MLSQSALMSSALQAVQPGESFTPLGYRPEATPASQVDLPTGKTARTCGKRMNPVMGIEAATGACWDSDMKLDPLCIPVRVKLFQRIKTYKPQKTELLIFFLSKLLGETCHTN